MEEHDSRSTEKETSNLYGSIGDAQDSSSSSEEEDKIMTTRYQVNHHLGQ